MSKGRRAERSGEAQKSTRAENFIPWEQIEPLIRPGMTTREMGDAVHAMLGLSRQTHRLATRLALSEESALDVLRDGLTIVRRQQAEQDIAAGIGLEIEDTELTP